MTGQDRTWWCEYAWLPEGPVAGVRIYTDTAGRISKISAGALRRDGDLVLHGMVLPGLANVHCHAFYRALRGRTHERAGSFWTWRERMYSLAGRLDPETYADLATAVYGEMVLAGITAVGEFHFLHHGPGGARYADPNAMGEALREAAWRAGIRLTLLDTCYLSAGIGIPLDGVQRRFDDGDAEGWADRAGMMADSDVFRVGAGIHSVRAVPADQLRDIVDATTGGDGSKRPLHVHVSEFSSENAASLSGYGLTPTRLLSEHGVLGKATTVVHATHVTDEDVALIGGSGSSTCVCPTTAGDLGTGIAPVRALVDAGSPLTLGTDQHASIDLLGEARILEMAERLRTQTRGVFDMTALVRALTRSGYLALGWDGGQLRTGAHADFFCLRLDTVRTAGCLPDQALMAATATDVDTVVVGGRRVVRSGQHVQLGDIGGLMRETIERAWRS